MRTPFRLPAVTRNPLSLIGMAIATAMAMLFLGLMLLETFGYLTNPYIGIVVFVAVPVIFIAGLLLIPIGGWWSYRRQRRHPEVRSDGRSSICARPTIGTCSWGCWH
jgi:hypothetical protein